MEIENSYILNAALSEGINLFLGAGFSLYAENVSGKSLPLGSKLAQELTEHFHIPEFSELTLPQLCTYLKASQHDALVNFLSWRFTVEKFDPIYTNVTRIALKWVFTTNIDDLLFQVFKQSTSHYLNDIDNNGPAFGDSKAVQYVSLHGSVKHPARDFIFGSEELAAAFAEDNDRWRFLTQALQERPTVFVGYGVADAAVLQALNPRSIAGRPTKEKWLLVQRASRNPAIDAMFRAMGFSLITGDTRELLDLFGQVPSELRQVLPNSARSTRELFPSEFVPNLSDVPVRPVIDFFLGAPPEWSDIYSQAIHQVSHFLHVKDTIMAGINVALIGLPACGKTTLLMQLSAFIQTPKRKIFLELVTLEKAENIITTLDGDQCIIFIDNLADSLEAIEAFSKVSSIQIIGAERDFMFGMISQIIKRTGFEVIDITELTEFDLQKCVSSIPPTLGFRGELNLARKRRASLFEVIEANVDRPNLKTRFRKVLSLLESESQLKHDMLIMMCYVFACRTPVSMDMLIAFCREHLVTWEQIVEMRRSLGQMLTEYFGEYAAENQDYFCPRSSYVAEAVLEVVSAISLRRVLEQVCLHISPARICRFDVFKKQAYSAELVRKGFPRWEEGREFYEKLFQRDNSPWLYQQCALYLSKLRQHAEAFAMIDLAITASMGRIWSIRNSHAIILFKANIEFSDQVTARNQLKRSMDTLAECIKWDKRKAFHASTYAKQALELRDRLHDPEIEGYLKRAKEWLADALKEEPWNRQCRYTMQRLIAANA